MKFISKVRNRSRAKKYFISIITNNQVTTLILTSLEIFFANEIGPKFLSLA